MKRDAHTRTNQESTPEKLSRGESIVETMLGKATVKLTTAQIMSMTRDVAEINIQLRTKDQMR